MRIKLAYNNFPEFLAKYMRFIHHVMKSCQGREFLFRKIKISSVGHQVNTKNNCKYSSFFTRLRLGELLGQKIPYFFLF